MFEFSFDSNIRNKIQILPLPHLDDFWKVFKCISCNNGFLTIFKHHNDGIIQVQTCCTKCGNSNIHKSVLIENGTGTYLLPKKYKQFF